VNKPIDVSKLPEATVSAYENAMIVKNCSWAKTLPELLDFTADKIERDQSYPDPVAAELRRASGLLQIAELIKNGETPISVACSYCKIIFKAKAGGEAYPEGMRVSHGCCPMCSKIQDIAVKEDHMGGS